MLPIAITAGEPSSISVELLFKAWLKLKTQNNICFFIIHNIKLLQHISKQLNCNIEFTKISNPNEASKNFANKIPVIDIPFNNPNSLVLGQPNPDNVSFVIQSLDTAVDYAQKKLIKAITTLPIEKYIMQQGGFNFIGHTEYLANKSSSSNVAMLLASPNSTLRVCPVQIHLSLQKSISTLTTEQIVKTATIVHRDLSHYLNKKIKIAILGLNPHAGEQGLMGNEEITIITPAIDILQSIGIDITGPIPADTAFNPNNIQTFDIIIGMYHDQVLTPFKALLFDYGVNVTLGLPFLRTSPDHGTALDIATKNIANPNSLISALQLANNWG